MKKNYLLVILLILVSYCVDSQEVKRGDTIYLAPTKARANKIIKTDGDGIVDVESIIDRANATVFKKPQIIVGDILPEKNVDIVKVEVKESQYHITYFSKDGELKKFITNVKQNEIVTNAVWKMWTFSVMVVPLKVRPAISGYKQYAKADLKTAGLYTGIINRVSKHYLRDGTVNEYKISAGLLVAPSAEEFNSSNTGGKLTSSTTNLVLSNGITIAGAYRSINFAIIPAGFDIGLTKDAKNWIYNTKYWFGFAIGLDSKLIGI